MRGGQWRRLPRLPEWHRCGGDDRLHAAEQRPAGRPGRSRPPCALPFLYAVCRPRHHVCIPVVLSRKGTTGLVVFGVILEHTKFWYFFPQIELWEVDFRNITCWFSCQANTNWTAGFKLENICACLSFDFLKSFRFIWCAISVACHILSRFAFYIFLVRFHQMFDFYMFCIPGKTLQNPKDFLNCHSPFINHNICHHAPSYTIIHHSYTIIHHYHAPPPSWRVLLPPSQSLSSWVHTCFFCFFLSCWERCRLLVPAFRPRTPWYNKHPLFSSQPLSPKCLFDMWAVWLCDLSGKISSKVVYIPFLFAVCNFCTRKGSGAGQIYCQPATLEWFLNGIIFFDCKLSANSP